MSGVVDDSEALGLDEAWGLEGDVAESSLEQGVVRWHLKPVDAAYMIYT